MTQAAIERHKQAFEAIYSQLDSNAQQLEFPLEEIEKYQWNRGACANDYYNYFYRRTSTHILHRLDLREDQRLLVIGCGAGDDEKNIHHLFASIDLWSIDVSEEMLLRALAGQAPSRFALSLAEKLPFPDACFDRILAREVIEHVLDPRRMMQEVGRVLKPGGLALITTPNSQAWSPERFYEDRLKPGLARWLRCPLPPPAYKDEPPSREEINAYAQGAELSLQGDFIDCSLYFFLGCLPGRLPRWQEFFRKHLAGIAHYFSCLENHRGLASIYCDQAKYLLGKPPSSSRATHAAALSVSYACPECHTVLHHRQDGYFCLACTRVFPLKKGIPDFIASLPNAESRSPVSLPSPSAGREKLFASLNALLRWTYSGLYLGSAVLASLPARKNREQMTRLIPKSHPYQKYIRLP